MIYKYNKLVRDKIPQEINNLPNKKCKYYVMDDKKYNKELDKKLLEEVNEYKADHSIEELADVMEVLNAIIEFRNISQKELNTVMENKRNKKGAFKDKIFLEEVEEEKNKKEEQNFTNKQQELFDNLNSAYSIKEMQSYINSMINLRGLQNGPVEKIMLLLTEEVGELAKSIRKNATNMKIDSKKMHNYDTIESEIADVFIVLNSICNILNIDLYEAIYEKEKINIKRQWN